MIGSELFWKSDFMHFHQRAKCPENFTFLLYLTPGLLNAARNGLSLFNFSQNFGKFWLGWWTETNHGSKQIWKSNFNLVLDEKDFELFQFPKIYDKNAAKQCLIGFVDDGKLEFTTKNCRRKARWICTKTPAV